MLENLQRGMFPLFIVLNQKLTNKKIRDDFLVFAAGRGSNTVLNWQFVI